MIGRKGKTIAIQEKVVQPRTGPDVTQLIKVNGEHKVKKEKKMLKKVTNDINNN